MAFVKAPNTWIANWAVNSSNIVVPIASFPELAAAPSTDEADGATGDIRRVVFALMEKLYSAWNALDAADRPTKMTIAKSVSPNVSTGVNTNTYTIRVYTAISAQEVEAEA